MKLRTIMGELHSIFNPKSAEEWDNVGLLIGNDNMEIKKILFCLDLTTKAIDESIKRGANLIISHHPAIFSGIKRITNDNIQGKKILKLIENKIAVYSAHTNLDFAANGLNDFILNKFELDGNIEICNDYEYEDYNYIKNNIEKHKSGTARIKHLNKSMKLSELIEIIKEKLGLDFVRYVGNKDTYINRIGLVTGGGSSFMHGVKEKIDVFLTGDLRHHEALDTLEEGGMLIDIGHYESEYLFSDLMEREVSKFFHGEMIKFFDEPIFKLG